MGEGSGIVVLEELDHAVRRKAPNIYGEVVGYGMTADAYHITEPDPEGRWLAKAIKDALRMGETLPEEVDYINPHGTSTPWNDKVETKAIKDVFREACVSDSHQRDQIDYRPHDGGGRRRRSHRRGPVP